MWILFALVTVLATGEVRELPFPSPFDTAAECEEFKASDGNAMALDRLKVRLEEGTELTGNECVEVVEQKPEA